MLMKKQLFAAAALLAVGGAAQAQMSLYGLVDLCYGKGIASDLGVFTGGTPDKADVHSGGDNFSSECNSTTRVGLKGSYEVAKGVKANFKFETAGITSKGEVGTPTPTFVGNVRTGDIQQPFFNRQAWAGLSGEYGEVRVGRQDSIAFQVMTDFDFNGASNGVSAGAYSGVGVWARGRQSRSIQYLTPAMGGLSAQFGLKVKGSLNSQATDGDKDVFSGAVKYSAGPLLIGGSFQTKTDSTVKDDFYSLAGSYDFGFVKAMIGYADGGKGINGGTGKGISVGAVAPLAGFNVGFHYANNNDDSFKIKAWEIFVNKEVFKNTYAYIEGGEAKSTVVSPSVKGTGAAAGVIYVF